MVDPKEVNGQARWQQAPLTPKASSSEQNTQESQLSSELRETFEETATYSRNTQAACNLAKGVLV